MPTPKHSHVVSSTPGRTRLRVSDKRRNPQEMARIASALKARPEVHDVSTNVQTGSILVHHDQQHSSLYDISATLRDLGVILGEVTDTEIPFLQGKSDMATGLTSAISDLNQRVGLATNGVVDLRFLFPLGLAALALRQLQRNGLQIDAAPWYVLAWYAFDSFIKLHSTQEPQATNATK